jgi:hypothetical protein
MSSVYFNIDEFYRPQVSPCIGNKFSISHPSMDHCVHIEQKNIIVQCKILLRLDFNKISKILFQYKMQHFSHYDETLINNFSTSMD